MIFSPPLFNFGLSQEDEYTDAKALHLSPEDRVLCVASAGEMPLSLFALGAGEVVAVDVSLAQLALSALKLTALRRLPHEDALGLLGFLPRKKAVRHRLFNDIARDLEPQVAAFWKGHPEAIAIGPIWAGRYERYTRLLVKAARPVLGSAAIDGLFEARTIEEQVAHYERTLERPLTRAIFRMAFYPPLFRLRGMDPRSLAHRSSEVSLGDQYYGQFRDLCTATLARENPLFQLFFLGRLLSADVAPQGLSHEAAALLQQNPAGVTFVHGDVASYLAANPRGRFNKVQLSNIPDWLSQPEFDGLMRTIADRVAPGRLVYRFIHVDRPLPLDVVARIQLERQIGVALRKRDRFPFYSIIPGAIAAAGASS